MANAPRMSASATLVTISFRPDTSTASSTPTRPMMIRGPKTGGAAAVLVAATGAVTVREVMYCELRRGKTEAF
ncbi:hypothetical protein D3C81_2106770 [compost metagenome]